MGRRHTAQKRYGADPDGKVRASFSCGADGCDWESDPALTDRQQREQHRQHRRDNGEDVKGLLKLEHAERIKTLRRVHDQDHMDCCAYCDVPWPCLHWHVLDGDAGAAEELLKQVDDQRKMDDFGR